MVTNTGCFADVNPSHVESNRLQRNEILVANAIENLLNRQDTVRVLDVGGMLGSSFVRIASTFPQEVASGRLHMIVTNLEPDFTITAGIAEAKRRIAIHDHWNEIVHLLMQTPGNAETLDGLSAKDKRCFMSRWEDIAFLENNHQLVTYVSGVDTMDLPQTLMAVDPIFQADIIHERFGGFYHHPDRHNVLSAVARVINPTTGSIMTTTPIDSIIFLEGFERLIAMGICSLGHPSGGYWLYGMPKSPMAIIAGSHISVEDMYKA